MRWCVAVSLILTHWGGVTHICVIKHTIKHIRLVAWSVPSHYLNQCWHLDIWTTGNIFQWNSNKNAIIHSRKCVWKCYLSQPQCVNGDRPHFMLIGEICVLKPWCISEFQINRIDCYHDAMSSWHNTVSLLKDTTHSPWLIHKGEVWGVFCGFQCFCLYHCYISMA